jgi:hypothetical protein
MLIYYLIGGKSAILTAITIALGGKATATSRGNSLKSFVKEGKQTAIVEVTLRNTGDEAFKPQQYKNKIVIERTIRADGSGSWKIKSGDKRVISTKREELNAICDHANIQVDNPMNILTQDSARQFLSQSHSDEKYEVSSTASRLPSLPLCVTVTYLLCLISVLSQRHAASTIISRVRSHCTQQQQDSECNLKQRRRFAVVETKGTRS